MNTILFPAKGTMHKFSPENALRLERAERYTLIPPKGTLQRFGLSQGMTIADIGAGTGFFSRPAAELVGSTGTVYAVDMSREMVGTLTSLGLSPNMRTVVSQEYSVPLPDAVADIVFVSFVLHETDDRPRFLRELYRLVKPGGQLVIVEWKKQAEEHGPPMEERLSETELDVSLAEYPLLEGGQLNASHFYRRVRKA